MTTTTSHASGPAPDVTRPVRDLRPLWRVLVAVALPLGPLCITVVRAVMPGWTADDTPTIVTESFAAPGRLELMSWLALIGIPALLVGVLAIGYLVRRSTPVLATLGATITFVAFASAVAIGSTDPVLAAAVEIDLDVGTAERLVTAMTEAPAAAVGVGIFVIGHILGLLLLGIALWRSTLVPRWVAVAIAVSQPIHFVSAVVVPSRLLDVVLGWGLTTVGFAAIGLHVLRMSDDEWDRPPVGARRPE